MLGGYFEHQRRVQFEGCVARRCRPLRKFCWVKLELLILRMVLQDALSEVVKRYPPMNMKVFADDITACLEGRNKELPEIAEKVLTTRRMEVEEKCLELSVTEGETDGKSKVIASCSYL